MNVELIKQRLLELAIQGKLVPQLDEEPEVEQIGEAPREVPFEIPGKWKWVNLGQLIKIISGTSYKKSDETSYGSGIRIIRGGNIREFKINLNADDVFVHDGLKDPEKIIRPNDIVIVTSTGSKTVIGNPGVCPNSNGAQIGAFLRIVRPLQSDLVEYIKIFFQSDYYRLYIRSKAKGTNINNIKNEYLENLAFPLPPLPEQRRIVARLQTLLPLIETYEKNQAELTRLTELFKASLLEQAIQGKLVPQLDEESEVEQIGEVPKEVPFEIPGKWKWIYLSDLSSKITDGTHHSPVSSAIKSDSTPFLYITAKNIKYTGIDLTSATYISTETHNEIYSRCNPEYGDVLFIKDGATTGIVTINNLKEPFSLLSSVALIKPKSNITSAFLVYALKSSLISKIILSKMQGTGIPRVTLKILKNIPLPLPSISEQRRIVARLQELQALTRFL